MPDPRDVSASKLLHKIVCEMVDQPEFVVIKTHVAEDGARFNIDVHPGDTGKVIGRQGRNAKSIRTLLGAAGMKLSRHYTFVITEEPLQ